MDYKKEDKELAEVEQNLLKAMKEIDNAMFTLSCYVSDPDEHVGRLIAIKKKIKSELNRHFDALARQRHLSAH